MNHGANTQPMPTCGTSFASIPEMVDLSDHSLGTSGPRFKVEKLEGFALIRRLFLTPPVNFLVTRRPLPKLLSFQRTRNHVEAYSMWIDSQFSLCLPIASLPPSSKVFEIQAYASQLSALSRLSFDSARMACSINRPPRGPARGFVRSFQ